MADFPCWCNGDPTCHRRSKVEYGLCSDCELAGHRASPPLPFSLAEPPEAPDSEANESPEVDAWKQIDDIWRKYTQEWEVRPDLVVTALGPGRCIRLRVGDWSFNKMKADPRDHTPEPRITERNVGTMRALAEALLAACDFVDQANPEWASRR